MPDFCEFVKAGVRAIAMDDCDDDTMVVSSCADASATPVLNYKSLQAGRMTT